MIPKVFISSTYNDLVPYREKIWEKVSSLNIEILGMEKFGARKSTPLDTCLEEVSRSDIFVGIISYCCGSINKKSNKSFTQLEYDKAVSLGKEIMIYFMAEDASIYPIHVDKGIKAKRLDRFKEILKDNHTIDTFKDPEELATKIYERLKIVIPKLIRKSKRPKVLPCRITRFTFRGEPWAAFVGYLLDKPFEIFTGLGDEEILPIPTSVIAGNLVKSYTQKGKVRFDFSYTDKYGWKKSFEGINHMYTKHTSRYCSIITKLLQKNISVAEIVDVIDDMDVFEGFSSKEWKLGVKKALFGKTSIS